MATTWGKPSSPMVASAAFLRSRKNADCSSGLSRICCRRLIAMLVRIHDRAQHDPALVGPVVAGAAVHRRALVPDQDVADAPAVVIDESLLGRVSGELLDHRPRLLTLHADEAMRVHGIDEQDRTSGHRMPRDRGPRHLLILLVGHALVVAIQALAGWTGAAAVQAGEAREKLSP